MTTEAWVQILLVISIVAVTVLAFALVRLFVILGDVREVSKIIAVRAQEVDEKIDLAEEKIGTAAGLVKGFIYSLDIFNIINKRKTKKKGDSDE